MRNFTFNTAVKARKIASDSIKVGLGIAIGLLIAINYYAGDRIFEAAKAVHASEHVTNVEVTIPVPEAVINK